MSMLTILLAVFMCKRLSFLQKDQRLDKQRFFWMKKGHRSILILLGSNGQNSTRATVDQPRSHFSVLLIYWQCSPYFITYLLPAEFHLYWSSVKKTRPYYNTIVRNSLTNSSLSVALWDEAFVKVRLSVRRTLTLVGFTSGQMARC